MASGAEEQVFGRLRLYPRLTNGVALEDPRGGDSAEVLQFAPTHVETMLETVRIFIDRRCTVDEHRFVSVSRLWLAWKEDLGHNLQYGPSLKMFVVLLQRLGFKVEKGRSFYSITGLTLDQPANPDKLLDDLKLARHDAVMAESAMRAHLVNRSLATVPVAGFGALIEDSARAAARYSQALHNLSRLASRAKALGVLL